MLFEVENRALGKFSEKTTQHFNAGSLVLPGVNVDSHFLSLCLLQFEPHVLQSMNVAPAIVEKVPHVQHEKGT